MSEDPRENIYDTRIAPLMSTIIKICKGNSIPFVAAFQLSGTEVEEGALLCTSCWQPDDTSERIDKAVSILYHGEKPITWSMTITRGEE